MKLKKSLFALILAVCLLLGLMPLMAPSASAAISNDTVAYYLAAHTMKKGETVRGVCNSMGINFYANQDLISSLNGITNYNSVSAGKTVYLPVNKQPTTGYAVMAHVVVAGDSFSKLCGSYGVSYSTNVAWLRILNSTTNLNRITRGSIVYIPVPLASGSYTPGTGNPDVTSPVDPDTSTTTPDNSGNTGSTEPPVSDSTVTNGIAYYLVPHTMKSGETMAKVCSNLGISYTANKDFIAKLNNIANLNSVAVGKTVYLPVSGQPSTSSYIAVVAYTVAKGDTVNKICKNFGVEYGNVSSMFKFLSNISNPSKIMPGQLLYIPVPVGSTSGGSTGSSGTTGGMIPSTPEERPTLPDAPNTSSVTATLSIPSKGFTSQEATSLVTKNGDSIVGYISLVTDENGNLTYQFTSSPQSTNYFLIVSHIVKYGDRVGTLCQKYNVDYSANGDFILAINYIPNLNTIYSKDPFFMPVYVVG